MNKPFGLMEFPIGGDATLEPPREDWMDGSSRVVARGSSYLAAKRKLRQQTRQSKRSVVQETSKSAGWRSGGGMTIATVTKVTMSHLKIVDHVDGSIRMYWFRNPTTIDLIFAKGEVSAHLAHQNGYAVFGSGRHRRGAIESLSCNVDQQIQRLIACLPMQLCDEEQMIRDSLESLFDLDRYRSSRRIESIESARFSRVGDRYCFECFGGPDLSIESKHCQGLFRDLASGDWCEIAVRKRLADGNVESIQLRRMIDEPATWSEEEFRQELSELPKADFPQLGDGPIQTS